MRNAVLFLAALLLAGAPAFAQTTDDRFSDGADGAKIHASGFACPSQVAGFERDAVGAQDAESQADFCAYSALDGVYGTVTMTPLSGPYDAKAALASQFDEQEGVGGKQVGEATVKIAGREVFTRTYETTSLEDLRYRIIFVGAMVGNYALEATVEFATPRDDSFERDFLNFVYGAGAAKIGGH